MNENTEVFLEHHGIKGMRWGVRRENLDRINRVAKGTATRSQVEQKKKAARSRAIKAASWTVVGGSALAGAAAVALILKRNKDIGMSEIRSSKISDPRRQQEIKNIIAGLHRDHQRDIRDIARTRSNIAAAEQARRLAAMKLGLPIQN